MDSKVISVLLKRTSAAGDYSCADGEIDRCEGLKVLSSVAVNPDGDGGATVAKMVAVLPPVRVRIRSVRSFRRCLSWNSL